MAPDTRIGARIRTRRQELGLTQKELAERVGADESSVINWESGKHYPKRKLGALESVLGVSLHDDNPEPVPPQDGDADALERLERSAAELQEQIRELRARQLKRSEGLNEGNPQARRRAG